MDPLESYLQELSQIHTSGANVKELSFYPALRDLLDSAGKELKPKVRCVMSIKNQGAGLPDGGLFAASQLKKLNADSILDQIPERGVIEVKGPQDVALEVAQSSQVVGYAQRYDLVLVTNLREFVLVKYIPENRIQILESFSLASDEDSFWNLARHPRATTNTQGIRLQEFLKRALLYQAELSDPKDLAWFLASYARDAHAVIDAAGDLPALKTLRQSMQQALNMEFEGEKGEHFFRSTLVQTLFYGIFSAWVLWHHENPKPGERFDWRLSAYKLKVPVIRSLFYQISDPHQMEKLGLTKFLDLTGDILDRVNREVFFAKFDQGQAVQYFYEPFLEAFDPELRKELGVWYTPREIVQYMVERVDRVLREELGVKDGLADPKVYVLDPCCGTGAYPLEVLHRIEKTLREKGENALLGYELKQAATKRVFGFEILPAPFVIAHLQMGLFLHQHGSPLDDDERASVYLTNSLTGWEPPKDPKQHLLMTELEQEQDAAEKVKREAPVLVILGNPPYNAFAGVAETDEGKEMVRVYKESLGKKWGIKKYNLDELYVRFFRLAEHRIVEKSDKGIVCFISNFSYLADPSYVVMREHLLNGFDKMWFDCLNGDSRETGKTTPEGLPDPSVFSTEFNKEGIRLGTTIGLMVRKSFRPAEKEIKFRHFWGINKRNDILESLLDENFEKKFISTHPVHDNWFSFRPSTVSADYLSWPKITDLCSEQPFVGLEECRGGSLIDIDKQSLINRMHIYFDGKFDWNTIENLLPKLAKNSAGYNARSTREKVLTYEGFDANRIVSYIQRPFDNRWAYYSPVKSLWNRPRPSFWEQCRMDNYFLVTRFNSQSTPEGFPMYISRGLVDKQAINRNPGIIPFQIKHTRKVKKREEKYLQNQKKSKMEQIEYINDQFEVKSNLSKTARSYLLDLSFTNPDSLDVLENGLKPHELIWFHSIAIGYSPMYLSENKNGIRGDWPHIPFPAQREMLLESAILGRQVVALLDIECPLPDSMNSLEISQIAVLNRTDGKQINPQTGDLALNAGWGHLQGKIVMPAQGKVVKNDGFYDIYLNDKTYWKNIPQPIWEYVIGGYQVIKKWLSYREKSVLGRDISVDEAREVTNMARRIAGLIKLQKSLDINYELVKKNTYVWKKIN